MVSRGYAAKCRHINAGLIGQWIIDYLVIALVLYLSLKKIVWDFREKDYGISRTELLFILTPAAVGLMICMLLRIIIVTMEDGTPKLLYDRYPILIFILPAILLLSLLSILHGVKLFQDMVYWNKEKSNRIVLEKQVGSLQEHMEEMERINSGICSLSADTAGRGCGFPTGRRKSIFAGAGRRNWRMTARGWRSAGKRLSMRCRSR